jgi:hypothetical protein
LPQGRKAGTAIPRIPAPGAAADKQFKAYISFYPNGAKHDTQQVYYYDDVRLVRLETATHP